MTKTTLLKPGFLAAIPVAAVIALTAGSGTAMAGAHGGTKSPCPSHSPQASHTPSPSATPSDTPEPSDTPSATPTPSPSDEPDGGMGGGEESESPTPSPTDESDGGDTLPDTGAAGVMGGMAGAGTIGYASYMYLRSKRRVIDAMRKR